MKSRKALRAILGIGLCGLGLWLALSAPYRARTFRIAAGGCQLITDILEPTGDSPAPQGYVVVYHGLAANKRIMSYYAQGFADQGLRVFVPDSPGHGRTAGTFSYQRADECSENLLRELTARGLLDPEKTILAGHSLGGAIALRVASRVPVAAVVAISPAPMHPVPGIPVEAIPFNGFGATPTNSLILSGSWESVWVRDSAARLAAGSLDGTGRSAVIPHASHVGILFNATALAAAEDWAGRVLHVGSPRGLPSRRSVLGFFLGLAGILVFAGPFLREMLQSKKGVPVPVDPGPSFARWRTRVEYLIVALVSVGVLRLGNPLKALKLFEGDYLAGFLLLLGVGLLALHPAAVRSFFANSPTAGSQPRRIYWILLPAAVSAFLLHFWFTAWTDLSFSEAWLTRARWAMFPLTFFAVLPYHAAEELLTGPPVPGKRWRRLLRTLSLRATAWVVVVLAIFFFHSGEILLVLLSPFFAIFCLLQAWGAQVVREATASPAAAALFNAILLAGFCLVAFPAT